MTNNKMISIGVLAGGIGMLIIAICVLVWGILSMNQSKEHVKVMQEFVEYNKSIQMANPIGPKEQDLEIILPSTEKSLSSAPKVIVINIRKDGSYFLGPKRMSLKEIESELAAMLEKNPNQKCLVRGDKEVLHNNVAAAISVCKSAGINDANIGYKTSQ